MPSEVITTPFSPWKLHLISEYGLLKKVAWSLDATGNSGKNDRVLKSTRYWLDCYFSDPGNCLNGYGVLRDFLPKKLVRGNYFNLVLQVISSVPAATVYTYKEIYKLLSEMCYPRSARGLGSARSVGMACASNPWALVIPCHRVIGQGWTGGYCKHTSGSHVDLKSELLLREGVSGWARRK